MRWRRLRGIRGATTVTVDAADEVLGATRELLERMIEANTLHLDDVVSILFSATGDITSTFPAEAARELGWSDVPLLCMTEIAVTGALPRCIRVLMHVESDVPRHAVTHVYIRGAEVLRPDLTSNEAASSTVNHGSEDGPAVRTSGNGDQLA